MKGRVGVAGPLEQFTGDDRRIIVEMLDCVWGKGQDRYKNEVHFRSENEGVHFYIQPRHSGTRSHDELNGSKTLVTQLERAGLVIVIPPNPPRATRRGDLHTPAPEIFAFTDESLRAFHSRDRVDESDIRARIGRWYYDRYREDSSRSFDFDASVIAAAIGVDAPTVQVQGCLLLDVGIFTEEFLRMGATPPGSIKLSPEGLRWAVQDFPDNLGTMPTHVTVEINITQFVREVERLPIPDKTKVEVEELAEEFRKEPTTEKASRLFGMAADINELVPSVARLVTEGLKYFT